MVAASFVNLRFATFGLRSSNRSVSGNDTLLINVGGAGGAPNLVDASSSQLGTGSDSATALLSTTGIDRSRFQIGGANSGSLDLSLVNSSRVRARSTAQTGSATAMAGYPLGNTAPNAFTPSNLNGGVLASRFSSGGNTYISVAVGLDAAAAASSGGFPADPATAANAMVDSGQGYGWYNSDLSANRTDASAAPTGLDGLGGLLAAGVESSFDATATMAGTGDAFAASTGERQVGISTNLRANNEPEHSYNLFFGFDGAETASVSAVIVDGAADVTNAATTSANSGSTDASAAIDGVAGILNDFSISEEDEEDLAEAGNFAITINAAFGEVAGGGILANTASANSANGSSSAVAGSSFVGGVIDALQVLNGVTPPNQGASGEFTIEFGLDGVVDGYAEADSEATAFTGDGESGDDTFASAGNNNVVGVSVSGVQFDRDGEMVTEAVNRETATATTSRSGAAAEAYAGSYDSLAVPVGSRTKGLLRTKVNTGRDLFTSGRVLTLTDPLLAKADARGSAVASSVSADATAEAAESAEVFGIDQSTITVGGDVLSAAGPGEGLLGVNAYQQYSASATATSAAGSEARAIATAGDDGAAVKGIHRSRLAVGAGHLGVFATQQLAAEAVTTGTGAAVAATAHEAVAIDDSSIAIGGGPNQATLGAFSFTGLQAQAQASSALAAEGEGTASATSHSGAAGIRLNGGDAVTVGSGDIRAFGYVDAAAAATAAAAASVDASYSAVGILTASGDTLAVTDSGSIEAGAVIDAVETSGSGASATTTVALPLVSAIAGADASGSVFSIRAGAAGGSITARAAVQLAPRAVAAAGDATVNLGQPGDLVTGIRGANLNLGSSGLQPGGAVVADAVIGTNAMAVASGTPAQPGAATIIRELNAIGLLGLGTGNLIVGASSITTFTVNTSFTEASAVYGPAIVNDSGSAGGLLNYTTYTFGDGQLNTSVGLSAVSRATSFQFGMMPPPPPPP